MKNIRQIPHIGPGKHHKAEPVRRGNSTRLSAPAPPSRANRRGRGGRLRLRYRDGYSRLRASEDGVVLRRDLYRGTCHHDGRSSVRTGDTLD